MNTPDFILYDNKSYNDLLRDIVKNQENKRDQIDLIVSEFRDHIQTKGDAVVIGPQIQSMMDIEDGFHPITTNWYRSMEEYFFVALNALTLNKH